MNNIDKDILKRNIIRCEKALNENNKKYKFDLDYKKMWEDLVDKSLDLQEENRELKLQNLDLRNVYFNVTHINKIYTKKINRYIAKQQKFIKFLEDEIKINKIKYGDTLTDISYFDVTIRINVFTEILQKYRSIIRGNKDEK